MTDAPASRLLLAYRAATILGAPLAGPLLALRTRRGKEDPARRGERFGIAGRARPEGPLVWLHAASVGETVSLLGLIDAISRDYPVTPLLTTGTVTSARIAADRLPPNVIHQYVPLDTPRFVARFLDHWRPGLAIFAESELWPNMILEADAHGCAIALVNARMSGRSFARWSRSGRMVRSLLARLRPVLAQGETDAERLRDLGAREVICTGNLKFDSPAPAPPADTQAVRAGLAGRPCWAAASIHAGEDAAVLAAHAALAARVPGLALILAPRHPERGQAIVEAAASLNLTAARRTLSPVPPAGVQVCVLDTIGELGLAFDLADTVFMGGSLVLHGGQNPIEPAKLGCAIVHGPHVANFADIYTALDAAGGAREITDSGELAEAVKALLRDREAAARAAGAAAETVARFTGALDRTLAALDPHLRALAAGRRP